MLLNAQPDGSKILSGTAQVYADRLTSGYVRQGQKFLGNVTEIKISENDDLWEVYSSVTPDRALIASGVLKRTVKITATLQEVNQDNLAFWSQGSKQTIAQGAGSFAAGAGDPIGVAPLTVQAALLGGYWYPVSKRNITAGTFAMKKTTIGGAVVPTTDYEVDLATGNVYIKPGGAADGSLCWLEYTYGVDSRKSVSGADSIINAYIRVLGDPTAGPIIEAEFWKVVLSPSGDLGLIGEQPAAFPVEGRVLNDAANHPTAPYYLLTAR